MSIGFRLIGWRSMAVVVAPLTAVAFAGSCNPDNASFSTNNAFTDTLRVYYVGYPVGYETVTVSREDEGYLVIADLDYGDRGRRNHTVGSIHLTERYEPTSLEIARVDEDTTEVLTKVEMIDRVGTVMTGGETNSVDLPRQAFPIAGLKPISQHLALLRFWLANGQPSVIGIVPGAPINDVHIEYRGRDTLLLEQHPVMLDRYMVEGVVWGRESVWLDDQQRLAGFTSGGGGGLTFEAVRNELDPHFPQLLDIATQDRLDDLAHLSETVDEVATGASTEPLVLTGANLIDGNGGAVITNVTVIVRNGRIAEVGQDVSIPDDAETIDVNGSTIVPGLWDMHAHAMQIEWALVYLAAGVTTVRDMGNTIPFVVPFRDALRDGKGLGPRLILAGLIDGGGPEAFGAVNATTPEEGREAVRMYHDLDFEQMKLYSLLKPDVVAAISDEAHRLGMTVTGHVPRALTLLEAIDAGMDHIAHMPIRGDAQSDSVRQVIQALTAHGTVIDPTMSWGEVLGRSRDEPISRFQPGVDYLPPSLDQRVGGWGADVDTATAHARLADRLAVLKALHDAGVPVVVGTDEGVPGFSVYRDIELYVQAGLTPTEAIRAATAVPAEAMGMEDEVGTVEVGKRADLLILDADPLDDISNIRTGRFVMIGGKMYRMADLWRAIGFGVPE